MQSELPRDISSQQKRHTHLSDAPLDAAAFERAKYHILGLFKLWESVRLRHKVHKPDKSRLGNIKKEERNTKCAN